MFESDNKMKIYLCWLLLENTLSHFSLFLSLLFLFYIGILKSWHCQLKNRCGGGEGLARDLKKYSEANLK